ncbi:hypothetical protein [Vibrio maritimus]|uniref:hypothetical protein n=1 Tax=Vibrio maritimus TaxID=990268 RepID=UPI001F3BA430|nr:hypothetical protein [Vibrio maritimus]
MTQIIKTVHCPTCGEYADVRQRKGKYKQLDLKCPTCGVLNYQTRQGQAALTSLPEVKKPEPKPESGSEDKPENKPEYTGNTLSNFLGWE